MTTTQFTTTVDESHATPTSSVIYAELEYLEASPLLAKSPKLKQLLRYIIKETLAGRENQISAYSIATDGLGLSHEFDPLSNPLVRMHAGRLRKKLREIYDADERVTSLRILLPTGRYIPQFFNLTERDIDAAEYSSPARSRAISVGVMLFQTLGGNSDMGHFASGITSQILLNLTRYDGFVIRGPIQQARLEINNYNYKNLAKELRLDYLLLGEVQHAPQSLRVTAQLLDSNTEDCIWVDNHDAAISVEGLLDLQERIAVKTANAVSGHLGAIHSAHWRASLTKSPDELSPYEAALLSYHWGVTMTAESFERALTALEAAVRNYSQDATCRALLADMLCTDYFCNSEVKVDTILRAKQLTNQAVQLDPNNHDARWCLAQAHFFCKEFERSRAEFNRAVALNPRNALMLAVYGLYLPVLGGWEEAVEKTRQAIYYNPDYPGWYPFILVIDALRRDAAAEAIEHYKCLRIDDLFWGPALGICVYGQNKSVSEISHYASELLRLEPDFVRLGRQLISRLFVAQDTVDLIYIPVRTALEQLAHAKRLK